MGKLYIQVRNWAIRNKDIRRGGVYNDPACDGKAVNHGVNIVGYGVLNGLNYWVVRNTWGHRWGLAGYFLIQRGVNKCGIEEYPAYATAY